MPTILVAGASGRLGREVVHILRSRGVAVRALT
ncbi:MAG TPA: NmrA family NAD(P)-binding protein [Longimicrobiales bacterium]